MNISDKGIELIKAFEGIRDGDPKTVNLDPYLCPANVATIGWGHAISDKGRLLRGQEGLARAREIYENGITMEQAERLLRDDLEGVVNDVNWLLDTDPTQGQFDALVSFAFNVGSDIDADDLPEGLGDSTLLKKFKAGDVKGAADEFLKWTKIRGEDGVKYTSAGLLRRRNAERDLFLSQEA